MTTKEFVSKYYPFALSVTKGTGISPYLILSQALLESGAGESLLAKKFNNFFGVKAYEGWPGKKVRLKTGEQTKAGKKFDVMAEFIVFNSPGESFEHQIKFLQKQPRYRKAGFFDKPYDYKAQADSLQKAGYATDINYAKSITSTANIIANIATKLKKAIAPGVILIPLLVAFFFDK